MHARGDPNTLKPLGDIDDAGTSLSSVFKPALKGLKEQEEDKSLSFHGWVQTTEPNILAAELRIGEKGVDSDIERPNNQVFHRNPVDEERVPCVVALRLPPTASRGFMAMHIPHGRGAKTLLDGRLRSVFSIGQPDRVLLVEPVVPKGALEEATEKNRIKKVRLLARSADRFQSSSDWLKKDDYGSVELVIKPKRRGHVIPDPIRKYLNGDENAVSQLLEFEDLSFEEARVEVEMPSGGKRTVYIGDPDRGHPMMVSLDSLHHGSDAEDVLAALVGALDDVTDHP